MRSVRLVVAAALAAVVATAPVTSAASDPVSVAGPDCGLASTDVLSPGVVSGVLYGGPVYARSASRPVTGVYLLCTVQVGSGTHAGPDTANVTVWGDAVAAAAQPVTFAATASQAVYLCTEVWVDTGKGHVSVFLHAGTGQYSTSPFVPCEKVDPFRGADPQRSCVAGTGQVIVSPSLGLPLLSPDTNVLFSLTMHCAAGSLTANGVLASASCGSATGVGTTGSGSFAVTGAGPVWTLTGDLVGALVLLPPSGQSCLTGGVTQYQVTGFLVG